MTLMALWCVGLDRYLPAGLREHFVDFLCRESGEPGLSEGRDHQPAQTMSEALHATRSFGAIGNAAASRLAGVASARRSVRTRSVVARGR